MKNSKNFILLKRFGFLWAQWVSELAWGYCWFLSSVLTGGGKGLVISTHFSTPYHLHVCMCVCLCLCVLSGGPSGVSGNLLGAMETEGTWAWERLMFVPSLDLLYSLGRWLSSPDHLIRTNVVHKKGTTWTYLEMLDGLSDQTVPLLLDWAFNFLIVCCCFVLSDVWGCHMKRKWLRFWLDFLCTRSGFIFYFSSQCGYVVTSELRRITWHFYLKAWG